MTGGVVGVFWSTAVEIDKFALIVLQNVFRLRGLSQGGLMMGSQFQL